MERLHFVGALRVLPFRLRLRCTSQLLDMRQCLKVQTGRRRRRIQRRAPESCRCTRAPSPGPCACRLPATERDSMDRPSLHPVSRSRPVKCGILWPLCFGLAEFALQFQRQKKSHCFFFSFFLFFFSFVVSNGSCILLKIVFKFFIHLGIRQTPTTVPHLSPTLHHPRCAPPPLPTSSFACSSLHATCLHCCLHCLLPHLRSFGL